MSSFRFIRSAGGQAEILERKHKLSRQTRNLLLIINETRPADQWISQIAGCTERDLSDLVAAQLIEPVPAALAQPAQAEVSPLQDVQRLLRDANYTPLYVALNHFGKEGLGLMEAYRFSLDIERCSDVLALRALGQQLLKRLQERHGSDMVRRFGVALDPARNRSGDGLGSSE